MNIYRYNYRYEMQTLCEGRLFPRESIDLKLQKMKRHHFIILKLFIII